MPLHILLISLSFLYVFLTYSRYDVVWKANLTKEDAVGFNLDYYLGCEGGKLERSDCQQPGGEMCQGRGAVYLKVYYS